MKEPAGKIQLGAIAIVGAIAFALVAFAIIGFPPRAWAPPTEGADWQMFHSNAGMSGWLLELSDGNIVI
ncbi:MAG: hypothetical protein ACREQI_03020 [Candidatus Binataceae bacterium]